MSKPKKTGNALSATSNNQKTVTSEWFNDRMKHSAQIRCYKKYAFVSAMIVIFLMYFSFFALLLVVIFFPEYRKILENHRHFLGILLGLLIVPSALTWGVVRSVFKSDSETTADVLKAASSTHPFFN